MASTVRDLIEYNGLVNCKYEDVPHFRQVNLDYSFCIPDYKLEIEQLVKVWATPKVVGQKLVKTPVGVSFEGQKLTGYKLMVIGEIEYKVEYVANECRQSVHTTHALFPFCGYVVLPEDTNPDSYIHASVAIEDIHAQQLDCRCIYNNITLMLIADLC